MPPSHPRNERGASAATARPSRKAPRRSARRIPHSDFALAIAPPASQQARTNKRVLVADTGKRFCADVCDFLSQHGCHARAVHDLRHLLQALAEWQPTTLFLNASLPSLDLAQLAPLYAQLPRDFLIVLLQEPGAPFTLSVPPKTPCPARLLKSPCLTDLRHFL
ncbi:hypothetical protein [Pigmentiphaga sp.]|uniref:hypothetical protein n=1 Tax=Pigmentiphaga sp. TaxID=1977564 RepID=UPI00128BFA55|nr:hypothetical protein [Pigmentiphaga sp.]MPS27255.1 hypothetical protein [Alcaligenaceae bacterium SAGV5]MPS51601.1 hypothetical protein [Alcaligenaceae bacterium SAGV3]MPT58979.1 hypothetical protein [Alcaligenaceae bacterium]